MGKVRQIHLALGFIAPRGTDNTSLETYKNIALKAEAGKIDSLFLADGVWIDPHPKGGIPYAGLEPITLLSAIAAVTENIGLGGTASTSFYDPYNFARLFGSLDHISKGRAGWNIVTSAKGEKNFGIDELPPQEQRYERAEEFVSVVTALWNSWDGSRVSFTENGRVVAEGAIKPINHKGKYFSVEGALNLPPTPQNGPVLIQAGSSEAGRSFGSKYAELIFTATQNKQDSLNFYKDIKDRAVAYGRRPEDIKILPGANLYIAETEEQARQKYEEISQNLDFEAGRKVLERELGGADLTGLELDAPIPPDRLVDTGSLLRRQSRPELYRKLAVIERLPLRRIIQIALFSSGHLHIVGSPESIAAQLIEWFDDYASDGFNIVSGFGESSLDVIIEGLIPILQKKGYFRKEYRGTTLRENLTDQ